MSRTTFPPHITRGSRTLGGGSGSSPAATSEGPLGQLNYTGATAGNANQAEASKCWTEHDLTFDRIGIYIAAQANNIDLGVYSDSAGAPGTLLSSLGTTASPATGVYLATVAEATIDAGYFWIAMAASGTGFSCGYWSTPQWLDVYDTDALASTSTRGYSLATAMPLPASWVGGSASTTPRLLWVEHS